MRCNYVLVISHGSKCQDFTFRSTIPFAPRKGMDVVVNSGAYTVKATRWNDHNQIMHINIEDGYKFKSKESFDRTIGILVRDGWHQVSGG